MAMLSQLKKLPVSLKVFFSKMLGRMVNVSPIVFEVVGIVFMVPNYLHRFHRVLGMLGASKCAIRTQVN